MYQAYCLLGAFIGFALFVVMCFRIHETTKELNAVEAEIRRIEERTNPNARKKLRE